MASSASKLSEQNPALTQQQVADLLNISSRSVRQYVADGRLPAYRVQGGRSLRIYLADVQALLAPVPTVRTVGGGVR